MTLKLLVLFIRELEDEKPIFVPVKEFLDEHIDIPLLNSHKILKVFSR